MSRSEIGKILTLLMGAFPNANMTQETVVVYETMLADFSADQLYEVVLAHIATSKWFPSIAELREALLDKHLCFPSADEAMADITMGRTSDLIKIGKEALKRCGGQWEFKRTTNPSRWRDDFRRNYNELVTKEKKKYVEQSIKRLRSNNPIARLKGHE